MTDRRLWTPEVPFLLSRKIKSSSNLSMISALANGPKLPKKWAKYIQAHIDHPNKSDRGFSIVYQQMA